MSARARRLVDVAERIRAASATDSGWPEVLAALATLLSSDKAALFCWDHRHGGVPQLLGHGYDSKVLAIYSEHYAAIDPWTAAAPRVQPGKAYCDAELVSRSAFEASAFYADFCRPNDLGHMLGGEVVRGQDRSMFVSVLRGRRRSPYCDDDRLMLQALFPFLNLALEHRYLLHEARQHATSLEECLHRLAIGVLIVDGVGRVRWMNASAQQLVRSAEGIVVRHGRIRCTSSADSAALLGLLAKVAGGVPLHAGEAMCVRRTDRAPLKLHVGPVPCGADRWRIAVDNAVLLMIADPEARPRPATRLLRSLYGLTAAETALAGSLLAGLTVEAHAAAAGIGVGTARWHLKQVFAKTHTSRQSELILMLARGPAGVLAIP